jgi:hypothetical protein
MSQGWVGGEHECVWGEMQQCTQARITTDSRMYSLHQKHTHTHTQIGAQLRKPEPLLSSALLPECE